MLRPTIWIVGAAGWLVATSILAPSASAEEPPNPPRPLERRSNDRPPPPKVVDLGGERYRIGAIEVNKANRRFKVAGTIIRREPPLEFLAVTKGGYKAYESLLELDASAHEFNLACILIGLDAARSKGARRHFDPEPAVGDPVDLSVSWTLDGKTTHADAADLITTGGKTLARDEWVYTGSVIAPGGAYLAHVDGTVIGFVHDPASIIEHRTGVPGNYGVPTANPQLVPARGTVITLIVHHRKAR
jgi:hypothetical protein